MKIQGRNDPCHCGSGKKFKVCHGKATSSFNQQWVIVGIVVGIFLLFFFMDSGTNTTTLQNTFTASATFSAVQLSGLLNAASTGTLGHEATFTSVALVSGDTLQVTWTLTLG